MPKHQKKSRKRRGRISRGGDFEEQEQGLLEHQEESKKSGKTWSTRFKTFVKYMIAFFKILTNQINIDEILKSDIEKEKEDDNEEIKGNMEQTPKIKKKKVSKALKGFLKLLLHYTLKLGLLYLEYAPILIFVISIVYLAKDAHRHLSTKKYLADAIEYLEISDALINLNGYYTYVYVFIILIILGIYVLVLIILWIFKKNLTNTEDKRYVNLKTRTNVLLAILFFMFLFYFLVYNEVVQNIGRFFQELKNTWSNVINLDYTDYLLAITQDLSNKQAPDTLDSNEPKKDYIINLVLLRKYLHERLEKPENAKIDDKISLIIKTVLTHGFLNNLNFDKENIYKKYIEFFSSLKHDSGFLKYLSYNKPDAFKLNNMSNVYKLLTEELNLKAETIGGVDKMKHLCNSMITINSRFNSNVNSIKYKVSGLPVPIQYSFVVAITIVCVVYFAVLYIQSRKQSTT